MLSRHKMTSVSLIVLCVCLCYENVLSQYEETCTTLEGVTGKCTPKIFCAPSFNPMRESMTTSASFQLREAAQCRSDGDHTIVCCPLSNFPPRDTPSRKLICNVNLDGSPVSKVTKEYLSGEKEINGQLEEICTTVEGGTGKCQLARFCAPYLNLIRLGKKMPDAFQLREAQCGSEGNEQKVCCPHLESRSSLLDVPSSRSLSESGYITAFLEPPDCGFSNATFNRVVGGDNAHLGAFPWMALLGSKGDDFATTNWICGGSLISHRHILTAAHCIKNELNVVRLGELDFDRDDDGATPVDLSIKHKIKHENFNYGDFTNDIGILILEKDVEFTYLIRPICLPTREDLRTNSWINYAPFIAGWGNVDNSGSVKSHLQVAQLYVLNNSDCALAYPSRIVDERVMCVGTNGRDSCSGDSGGPLMHPDINQTTLDIYFVQTGVVSYGHRICALPGFPGVYSRVAYFMPWLKKHMLGLN